MEKFRIVRVLIYMMIASVLCVPICADDSEYTEDLHKAWMYVDEGNVEAAETQYEIYKGITGKTDSNLEAQIKSMKSKDWKSQCHIISVGKGKKIAVQKKVQKDIYGSQLKYVVKSSPVGDFTDWRLPTTQEMFTIIETLGIRDGIYYVYHKNKCSSYYYPAVNVLKKREYCYDSKVRLDCFLVRKLK